MNTGPCRVLRQPPRRDGISEKTLRRAKKRLRILSRQLEDGWVWKLHEKDAAVERAVKPEGEF